MKSHPLVIVEWEDAAAHGSWIDSDDVDEFVSEPYTVFSAGWLVAEHKKRIVIALNHGVNGSVSEIIKIPRAYIKKLRKVLK